MKASIRIALTDDQNLFREGMLLVLSAFDELDVIIETSSGQALLEQMENNLPDLVLLDYSMPEMDGFETLKKIKTTYPDVKVIILSMHYDESLMSFMMQNGADGYLLKDETSSIVKDAIIEVMEKGKYFPSYVSNAMLKQLQLQDQPQVKKRNSNSDDKEFSLREKEVLAIIGKYNRQEIADKLFISIKTVDFHLKNLRDKTNSSSTSELVRFALKNGFQE